MDDEEEVNYSEKVLNARTLTKLRGRYASVISNLRMIFERQKLNVKSLILCLASLDDDNMTIFSTDEAFKKIHNMTELFIYIRKYYSIYNYELLTAFVEATECHEAIDLLDGFTKELHFSVLSDLDLLGDDGELRGPKDFIPKLVIQYVGGPCTMEIEELVRKIICEHFHLPRGSIIFKGMQKDNDTWIYQISAAVKSHLNQKHPGCKKRSGQELKKAWSEIKMGGQSLCSVTADQNKILIITSQAAKHNKLSTCYVLRPDL